MQSLGVEWESVNYLPQRRNTRRMRFFPTHIDQSGIANRSWMIEFGLHPSSSIVRLVYTPSDLCTANLRSEGVGS
jgi:hypothetical protein